MSAIPHRAAVARPHRRLLRYLEKQLPLPNVEPAYYDMLGLALSLLFRYARSRWQKALMVTTILVSDWLDGATARRYRRLRVSGYVTDIVTDRASEALIFVFEPGKRLARWFLWLWFVNSALAVYSLYSKRHLLLPLRVFYLLLLLFRKA